MAVNFNRKIYSTVGRLDDSTNDYSATEKLSV